MAYTPATLTLANWATPITIQPTDLISGLDDAINAIVNTDPASIKAYLNTEIAKVPTYLSAELVKVNAETATQASNAANSASAAAASAIQAATFVPTNYLPKAGGTTAIYAMTAKASLVDNDELLISDSESSYSFKKVLVSTLKTIFQPFLVSGTNIKTVNGATLLGSGNISTIDSLITISTSNDINLASTSDIFQNCIVSTAGKSVILPNATTLSNGKYFIIRNNNSTINLYIKDFNGSIKCVVRPQGIIKVYLESNSTSSGVWIISDESINQNSVELLTASYVASSQVILSNILTSSSYIYTKTIALSNDVIIVCTQSSMIPIMVSGTVLNPIFSVGTAVSIPATPVYFDICESTLSGYITSFSITYQASAANVFVATYTVSNSGVITAHASPLAVSTAPSTQPISIAKLANGKVVVGFVVTNSIAVVVDVSTNTLTKGAETIINASGPYAGLVSTSAGVVCQYSINAFKVLSDAGTTVTVGTATSFSSGYAALSKMIPYGTYMILMYQTSATTVYARIATVGADVTFGTPTAINLATSALNQMDGNVYDGISGVLAYRPAAEGLVYHQPFTISSGVITMVGSPSTATAGAYGLNVVRLSLGTRVLFNQKVYSSQAAMAVQTIGAL